MPTLLLTAATTGSGLNVKGLVVLVVVFAVFYPLQRRFRAWVSKRRVERWEHDDLMRPPPPVDEPPVVQPPVAQPPVAQPPAAQPPTDEPPEHAPGDGPISRPQ